MSYEINYRPAKACGDCIYFNRYYTNPREDVYIPTTHGRCDYPYKKDMEEDEAACQYWEKTNKV